MAITPYLYYQDAGGALEFLAKAFGFRKYGKPMRGPDRRVNHAAMRSGDHIFMLGSPGNNYQSPKLLGQATQALYVDVDDVEKHFKRASRTGAKIIEEPHDTAYGARRYGAEDIEGHQWYFAQSRASSL